jgi:hypothetical protein
MSQRLSQIVNIGSIHNDNGIYLDYETMDTVIDKETIRILLRQGSTAYISKTKAGHIVIELHSY